MVEVGGYYFGVIEHGVKEGGEHVEVLMNIVVSYFLKCREGKNIR